MPDTPAPMAAVETMARSIGGASYGKEHLWDANAALRALASADEPTRLAVTAWLLPPGWRLAHDGITKIDRLREALGSVRRAIWKHPLGSLATPSGASIARPRR